MSYYFGIVLKNLVILGTDNYYSDRELAIENSLYRAMKIGKNFALLTGNLGVAKDIVMTLPQNPATIDDFLVWNNQFRQRICGIYSDFKLNHPNPGHYENIDILLGGFFGDKAPFLATISSTDDFSLKSLSKVGYIALNQAPEILAMVQKQLTNFLILAINGTGETQIRLGKKELPKIIQGVSRMNTSLNKNAFITPSGTLFFIMKDAFEIFNFKEDGGFLLETGAF